MALPRCGFEALTSREQEVLSLVTAGRMNKQIVAQLGVSEITVKVPVTDDVLAQHVLEPS
jgi:DNA-binding NarL/FixJ family response regulator